MRSDAAWHLTSVLKPERAARGSAAEHLVSCEVVRPVVVAPTYDNDATLMRVLSAIEALSLATIVVDDGSRDRTAPLLNDWQRAATPVSRCVVRHARNRGKGAALGTGFARARAGGYTHAVTIDTDGQHEPADAGRLLAAAEGQPEALVLGQRTGDQQGRPRRCDWGRRLADRAIRRASGQRIGDTQCGLRVYPLASLETVTAHASRYAYESEILLRAGRAGWPIVCVPVTGRYLPADEHVSHFRPATDSWRWAAMYLRVVIGRRCGH